MTQKEKEFEEFVHKSCVASPEGGLASVRLAKMRHMRKEITRLMKEDAKAQNIDRIFRRPTRKFTRMLSRFPTQETNVFRRSSM